MSEEDIEIVKDLIEFIEFDPNSKYRTSWGKVAKYTFDEYFSAIKNLLKENKELKENSISKDKIREKIEELDKAYEDSKDAYGESEYYYPDYTVQILKKLLEEE